MNLNKVSLIGHLDSTPRTEILPSGERVAAITLVTAEDQSPRATDAEVLTLVMHQVIAHGRLAQIILKYLRTGDRVYIEGQLRNATRDTEADGKPETEIVATQLIMLGGKSKARE